jgi:hypothetical protein
MCDSGGRATGRRAGAPSGVAVRLPILCCTAGVLVTLLACTSGAGFGSTLETSVTLPVVPPPHVRFPDGFDEHGCALIARGASSPQRVCPAVRRDQASAGTVSDWVRYLGYEGPPAVGGTGTRAVVILPDSLTVAARGWWRAVGLVRNDADAIASEVRVTVELATSGARPLGRATALVPVRNVRPGEPAPFELRTLLPVESVRHVTWSVSASTGGGTTTPSRMAEIEVGRITSSSSSPDPVRAEAAESEAVPIGWGILRNWGPLPITRVSVVGMWIDERGHAIRLVEGRVLAPSRSGPRPSTDLLPGGTRSFELLERVPFAAHGAGWRLALWQSTS